MMGLRGRGSSQGGWGEKAFFLEVTVTTTSSVQVTERASIPSEGGEIGLFLARETLRRK